MYNGQVLRKLIAEAGLTKKQFEEQVFQGKSTGLYHVETATSVTCNTLERMRDVLKCSMDDFFTTPEWATKRREKSLVLIMFSRMLGLTIVKWRPSISKS